MTVLEETLQPAGEPAADAAVAPAAKARILPRVLVGFALGFVLAVGLGVVSLLAYDATYAGRVLPGVRAAGIDLSGHDPDKTLSRKHARILRSKDGVFLKEEEGRNGTFVNGTRVGPGQTVRLEEGDRIRFGLVEVTFRAS